MQFLVWQNGRQMLAVLPSPSLHHSNSLFFHLSLSDNGRYQVSWPSPRNSSRCLDRRQQSKSALCQAMEPSRVVLSRRVPSLIIPLYLRLISLFSRQLLPSRPSTAESTSGTLYGPAEWPIMASWRCDGRYVLTLIIWYPFSYSLYFLL